MGVSYNDFVEAFLAKITEYDLLGLDFEIRDEVIKGYFKRTIESYILRLHDNFRRRDR